MDARTSGFRLWTNGASDADHGIALPHPQDEREPSTLLCSSSEHNLGYNRFVISDLTMVRTLLASFLILAGVSSARAEGPLPTSAIASSGVEAALPLADRVVVRKGERKLLLMRGEDVLRTYKVALGLRPEGHKQFEGDYRTPEGKYRLTRRNPNSEYFLSIQIDYPNETDIAKARRLGQRPGGAIMIHGQPNTPRKSRDFYTNVDWTEGCIAVSNTDMVEIWLMTPPDTPIEIRP